MTGLVRAVAAAAALVGMIACGSQPTYVEGRIPKPGPSIPYGLLALDIEVGDTRGARIMLKRMGYTTRHVDVHRDGTIAFRMQPGEWQVQVTGRAGSSDVITFDGRTADKDKPADTPTARGGLAWPETPMNISIVRNKLTDGGRVCAHKGCKTVWAPSTDPALDRWLAVRRLEVYLGPPSAPAPSPEAEPDDAAKPDDAGDNATSP